MREFRIPGVLQRFAGTYLIIATVHMFFAKPTDPNQVSVLLILLLQVSEYRVASSSVQYRFNPGYVPT